MNVEKSGQKRVKQSEHSPPAKRPRTASSAYDIFGNQILSGIQLPPKILTFGCGTYTKRENIFCGYKE